MTSRPFLLTHQPGLRTLTISRAHTQPSTPHWCPQLDLGRLCLEPGGPFLSSWVMWPFLHQAHGWQQFRAATHQLHQEGDSGKSGVPREEGMGPGG